MRTRTGTEGRPGEAMGRRMAACKRRGVFNRNQPFRHLDLRFPGSRVMTTHISVVYTPQSVLLCYGSSGKVIYHPPKCVSVEHAEKLTPQHENTAVLPVCVCVCVYDLSQGLADRMVGGWPDRPGGLKPIGQAVSRSSLSSQAGAGTAVHR